MCRRGGVALRRRNVSASEQRTSEGDKPGTSTDRQRLQASIRRGARSALRYAGVSSVAELANSADLGSTLE